VSVVQIKTQILHSSNRIRPRDRPPNRKIGRLPDPPRLLINGEPTNRVPSEPQEPNTKK
jgi:hypothetical protein